LARARREERRVELRGVVVVDVEGGGREGVGVCGGCDGYVAVVRFVERRRTTGRRRFEGCRRMTAGRPPRRVRGMLLVLSSCSCVRNAGEAC
jgi:hypothetical protein